MDALERAMKLHESFRTWDHLAGMYLHAMDRETLELLNGMDPYLERTATAKRPDISSTNGYLGEMVVAQCRQRPRSHR